MRIDKYLARIQGETSTMTFHIDSPQKKKKVLRPKYPNETDGFISDKQRKRVMIDFDGVIHDYRDGWNGGVISGELIPGTKEAIDRLKRIFEIVIFTTRAAKPEEESPSQQAQIDDLKRWLNERGIYYDRITGEKLGAFAYIDDKGIRFEGNWDYVLKKIQDLLESEG